MLRAGAAIGSRLRILRAMPTCRSLHAGSAFEPTETHGKLREMMRKFAEQEVDPQVLLSTFQSIHPPIRQPDSLMLHQSPAS